MGLIASSIVLITFVGGGALWVLLNDETIKLLEKKPNASATIVQQV